MSHTAPRSASGFAFRYGVLDTAKIYENEQGLKGVQCDTIVISADPKRNFADRYQSPADEHWCESIKCFHSNEDLTGSANEDPDETKADPGVGTSSSLFARVKLESLDWGAREDPLIQTKLWQTQHGRAGVFKAFDDSLKNLGMLRKAPKGSGSNPGGSERVEPGVQTWIQDQRLGALLMHHPGPKRGWPLANQANGDPGVMPANWEGKKTRAETWAAMEDLYHLNRVSVIGVCNFSLRQLKELVHRAQGADPENDGRKIIPMILQIEFHPLLQQNELLDYCFKHGILVQAYASLGGTEPLRKKGFTLTTLPQIVAVAKRVIEVPQIVAKKLFFLRTRAAQCPRGRGGFCAKKRERCYEVT